MPRKKGLPSIGELVICKITGINPNSAYAVLDEYIPKLEGMIHISEISSGWVRDIRSHVKSGQTVIAKVVRVDDRGVSLSLKRVDKKQEKQRLKEYNLDMRAEKMLERAAAGIGKTLDKAYNEVGFLMQESFGSLHAGFMKLLKNPELFREKGVSDEWVGAIRGIAEKEMEQKTFEFKAELVLKTFKPDGINIIKDILKQAEESSLEVKYISAPKYLVKYKTKDAKKGEKEFLDKLNKIVSQQKGVSAEFKVVK